MVDILLMIVCFSTGVVGSCLDCSWQNSRNERKNCIVVSDQLPKQTCANIFDDGSGNTKQPDDVGVSIQPITPYVSKYNTNKTSIKELALNVSFQLPVGVKKYEYIGLLIQVTFNMKTYCIYWDFFNEPLTTQDEGIILYFDCFYGIIPEKEYIFGISLLSRKSIGKEVAHTIEVSGDPCFYLPCGGNATCIRKQHLSYECQCNEEGFIYNRTLNACICLPCSSLTRRQRSNSNWKPEVQELKFTYAKATIHFSLEPHTYDCYHIILRGVKCTDDDSKNCRNTEDGPSVIVLVNKNNTLTTKRYRNSENPSNKVRAYFRNESEGTIEDRIVYVEIEDNLIERGHYRFLLRWYDCCHCPSYIQKAQSVTGPEYYSDDPCFYNPCGGATCTIIKRKTEDDLLEYECMCKEDGLVYSKSANKCIIYDEPCNGWCLKKTVAVLTTIISVMALIVAVLFYKRCNVKNSSDENVDASDEIDRLSVTSQDLRSLDDLKKFQEKIEREKEYSLHSSQYVSSSSGYMMVPKSDTTDSSAHCQCFSSLKGATSL